MRWLERAAWAVGIGATGLWMVLTTSGYFGARHELRTFADYRAAEAVRANTLSEPVRVDQRLWSPERMEAWRATLARQSPAALAVLRVPRVGVEAAGVARRRRVDAQSRRRPHRPDGVARRRRQRRHCRPS